MNHQGVQGALELHWKASDAGDFAVEHEIYDEAAVLTYPQSGERIVGRSDIQQSRYVQPNEKRFTVTRIIGSADLWITEFILSYGGKPSYAVCEDWRHRGHASKPYTTRIPIGTRLCGSILHRTSGRAVNGVRN